MSIPKKVKNDLLKKVEKILKSKDEKNFLLLLVSEDDEGSATGFLSNYENYKTLGLMEKSKLFIYEKIKSEEFNRTVDKNEEEIKEKEFSKLSYVG